MPQADHITVYHGSMAVDVPRTVFRGKACDIDEEAAAPFRKMIRARYPWLTENAVEVILNKARKEMMRVRDEETNGREYSKLLSGKGKSDEAIEHLRLRLEINPDDAKTWYDLGELLFRKGDASGGFDAFAKGDAVLKKNKKK